MLQAFEYPRFDYAPSPDEGAEPPARHAVVIVGAGPIGLTAALDLARRGRRVVVIDDDDTVSVGSRAICWSKRTLEICDRLGLADGLISKGVRWSKGRVFFQDRELYDFDLLPEAGHYAPAFVNLQQYHFEMAAVEAAQAHPLIELRWRNRLVDVAPGDEQTPARVTVETPEGRHRLDVDWLLACDGAKSPTRKALGLDFEGRVFQDRFLIADVVMTADFPTERWFWFDPPFNPGRSALLHKQADDVWRIDLQLGWDADPEEEKKPERVIPRLKAMLGEDASFELEWVSVYTFQCRRLERFRSGRVLFVGDSAHQVSPFGARGGNGGVQDVDNLGWKLDLVLRGAAPKALLDSYDVERGWGADENIANSTRATDFITPKSQASRDFRDATLALAARFDFARRLVNSGRLSQPASLEASPLTTPDEAGERFDAPMRPGAACLDAPIRDTAGREDWLLRALARADGFVLLAAPALDDPDGASVDAAAAALDPPAQALVMGRDFEDSEGLVAARYDLTPGACYLIRPDQHAAARFRTLSATRLRPAQDRALARGKEA
ncbi:MAG: FAD-dependent oxidoreductase [Marivibrio sp.]|uniref:FAD-dependent oxidoreductase n=1 Tax=Marivibrio sp. TaxID=2039719 RepID=UPI0032EF1F3C